MKDLNTVYVAASSDDIERAKLWMQRLRDAGFCVVSTWVETVEAVGNANPRDATREDRCGWANGDIEQVESCGCFWFLVPREANGRGAYFELGVAHALGQRLLVSSGDTKQSIFLANTNEFAEDLDAFTYIVRQYKAQLDNDLMQARRAPRKALP